MYISLYMTCVCCFLYHHMYVCTVHTFHAAPELVQRHVLFTFLLHVYIHYVHMFVCTYYVCAYIRRYVCMYIRHTVTLLPYFVCVCTFVQCTVIYTQYYAIRCWKLVTQYTANQPTKKFPVVLGQRIYYLSSDKASTTFLGNPHRYTSQPPPLAFLPPKIAIIGPPKSGKTSGTQMLSYFGHSMFSHMSPLPLVLFAVTNKLVSTLGVVKFSIGEALRYTS